MEKQHDALKRSDRRDQGFAHNLVLTVLRRLGHIDSILGYLLTDSLEKQMDRVLILLRLGIAQLLFLNTPGYAAVDRTVQLATGKTEGYRGLINAVLRRVAREKAVLVDKTKDPLTALPPWLSQKWLKRFGSDLAQAIAESQFLEPPIDLSASSEPNLLEKELSATLLPTGSLRLWKHGRIEEIPGFKEGRWWVQDAAAALPARLLTNAMMARQTIGPVVELCSAPGGKTAQLCSQGLDVTAVDNDVRRLKLLKKNLDRLDLNVNLVEADAVTWRPSRPPAAILLDPPCSSTGTLRRRPDVAWRRKPSDISRLAALQSKMLLHTAENMPAGCILTYSVCSLESEEGINQAEQLLKTTNLQVLPVTSDEIPGLEMAVTAEGFVQTLPSFWCDFGGLDGFFIARFVKPSF